MVQSILQGMSRRWEPHTGHHFDKWGYTRLYYKMHDMDYQPAKAYLLLYYTIIAYHLGIEVQSSARDSGID